MADEVDPALEARLSSALKSEADAVPFTLRADAVRRVAAERRRARRAQRLTVLVAAAVVLVAVGGLTLSFATRTPTNVAAPVVASSHPSPPIQTAGLTEPPSPATTPVTSEAPSATGAASLPSVAGLLSAAGQGAVQLAALEGDAGPQGKVVTFDPTGHRGAIAVVIACQGNGSVGTAFADSPLPSSDPGGSDSPFAPGAADCDDAAHVVPWGGWNAVGRLFAEGPHIGLSLPSGASYRAILADTSLVATDGEEGAVADGMSSLGHLSAIQSDDHWGVIVASREHLSAAGDTGADVTAADIRSASSIRAVFTCAGGSADIAAESVVAAGSATNTTAALLGTAVCDGTVQAFDWARTDGPSDAARLVINSTPGTSWRVVVRDVSSFAHPTPAVRCGTPDRTSKSPPAATLYQGGRRLGSVSYFTTTWGRTSSDGVPTTPANAVEGTTDPLVLRIAGDVCATGWTVLYGTPSPGGVGIDPAGALAVLGGYVTTEVSHENRIDLASLPPGDWVVEVFLTFADGDGAGVIRVHVT